MPTIRNKATLDSKPFTHGVDGMKAKVKGFGKSLASMKGAMAGAFAVGALVKWGRHATRTADEIDNLAKQTGLGIEEVQALKIAAEEAGVGFETMRPTINQFRRALDQAMAGNQGMIKSFKDMGVEIKDLEGMTVGESLSAVTKKMHQGAESAEVMAASTKVLGAESTRVQGILMEVGDIGVQGLIEKYQDLLMAQEAVIAADRQQERMERNTRRISSRLANTFAKGIGTIELLLRGGGADVDKEIFGDPEAQAEKEAKLKEKKSTIYACSG